MTDHGGPADSRSLTVLTWNVQNARPSRAREQADWLAGSSAQLVVLTEVPKADGGRALAAALTDHGFTVTTTVSPSLAGAGGRIVKDYVVTMAARTRRLEPVEDAVSAYLPHRLTAARLHHQRSADHDYVGVAGVYVPSRGPAERRNVAKKTFQHAVSALLPDLRRRLDPHNVGVPIVVTGDLNVLEPEHRPHHSNFGAWEYDFYRSFAENGLADAYRHLHPHGDDHSWYGRRSGAGYRFDHLFISTQHLSALTACWYDHQPRQNGLSDHSALLATLTI